MFLIIGVNDTTVAVRRVFAFATGARGCAAAERSGGEADEDGCSHLGCHQRDGGGRTRMRQRSQSDCDRVIPLPEVIRAQNEGPGLRLAAACELTVHVCVISLKGLGRRRREILLLCGEIKEGSHWMMANQAGWSPGRGI